MNGPSILHIVTVAGHRSGVVDGAVVIVHSADLERAALVDCAGNDIAAAQMQAGMGFNNELVTRCERPPVDTAARRARRFAGASQARAQSPPVPSIT